MQDLSAWVERQAWQACPLLRTSLPYRAGELGDMAQACRPVLPSAMMIDTAVFGRTYGSAYDRNGTPTPGEPPHAP
jgi:hypothetical protein